MTQRVPCADGAHRARAVAAALAALRRGDAVLLPTENAYAIAADAFSPAGLATLREAKDLDGRSSVGILVPSAQTVGGLAARIPDAARSLMTACWPGPLTLLLTAQPTLAWTLPAHSPVAVRQPLHPLTLAVLAATGPLAVSVATRAGSPVPTTAPEAIDVLGEWCALALDSGPVPTPGAPASSIVDVTGAEPVLVREGALSADALTAVLGVPLAGPPAP